MQNIGAIMNKLNVEDAEFIAKTICNYFDRFDRIDQFFENDKKDKMKNFQMGLPDIGIEDFIFNDFSIKPNDMEFKLQQVDDSSFRKQASLTASFPINQRPGRNLNYFVIELNTQKLVGQISLGSPVMYMGPRLKVDNLKLLNYRSYNGFVIVPTQPFGFNYLGGKLLALICSSHEVRQDFNDKFDTDIALFETTSLYGETKSVSQYDGLKPFVRNNGLTTSDFIPNLPNDVFNNIKDFIEQKLDMFFDTNQSSVKFKLTKKFLSIIKTSLKENNSYYYDTYIQSLENAKKINQKKGYYTSHFGFENVAEVLEGSETDLKIGDNFQKHYLSNVVKWWKRKATKRYDKLLSENRLINNVELWAPQREKPKNIIR